MGRSGQEAIVQLFRWPILNEVVHAAADRAAAELTSLLRSSDARTTIVEAPHGAGRSIMLRRVADRLKSGNEVPVLVAPPERHFDSAALALLDVAAAINPAQMTRHWQDSADWNQRISDLRAWFGTESNANVVLLLDAPGQWVMPGRLDVSKRSDQVANFLVHEVQCRKVLVGVQGEGKPDQSFSANLADGRTVLEDAEHWGQLSPVVEELREALPGVGNESPTTVFLLVAHAALDSVAAVKGWWRSGLSSDLVADRLAQLANTEPTLKPFLNAWIAAAVARRPVPVDWIEEEVGRIRVPRDLAVFNSCLRFGGSESALLRVVRSAAWRLPEDGFIRSTRDRVGEQLRQRYLSACESAIDAGVPEMFTLGAEAIYTASRVDDFETTDRVPIAFSDHLSGFGLNALERRSWSTAESAFWRAAEIDPTDGFARHHYAFSLDSAASEPEVVEREYKRSLELNDSLATWHSRLISFYIVRSRMRDARTAWTNSRALLLADDGDGPADLYLSLHLPVSANLLRRAELGMSYLVLEDVPAWARKQLAGYESYRSRLEVLEMAQETGGVVPAQRLLNGEWHLEPALLGRRDPDGRELQRWIAGGIESEDDSGVHLSVAVMEAGQAPKFGTLHLPWDLIERITSDTHRLDAMRPGGFIEVGYYGLGSETASDPVLRILPREDWKAGLSTELDPARYLPEQRWSLA